MIRRFPTPWEQGKPDIRQAGYRDLRFQSGFEARSGFGPGSTVVLNRDIPIIDVPPLLTSENPDATALSLLQQQGQRRIALDV